jgi:hypothetical protein
MDKIRKIDRAEAAIQEEIENKLLLLRWYVKATHGNIYQSGLPDLYCAHRSYGTRWLEVKNPAGFSFTPAQLNNFPLMQAAGVGIWVATSPDQVPDLFFRPPNWYTYLDIMNSRSRRA